MNAVASPALLDRVWQVLDAVCDPEIPVVSLRELGILRDVRDTAQGLEVVITPTYSGCPAMGQIEDDVKAALQAAGLAARVTTQLAPAWTTDWISEQAREKLRAYGIAPPGRCGAADHSTGRTHRVQFASKKVAKNAEDKRLSGHFDHDVVPCPRCGSPDTTQASYFGSTACKALFKCLDCLEPFDYFKPY